MLSVGIRANAYLLHGTAALTLWCLIILDLASITVSLRDSLSIFCGASAIMFWGDFFLRVRSSHQFFGAAEVGGVFICGVAVVCCFALGLMYALPISAGKSLGVIWVLGITMLVVRELFFYKNIKKNFSTNEKSFKINYLETAGFILIGVIAAFWARNQIRASTILINSGDPPVWRDIYLHANEIAQLARSDGFARGSILMVGEPLEFYHRAIYVFPAALCELLGVTPFVAGTAFLIPIGVFMCLLGVCELTRALTGSFFLVPLLLF
jgi:hypothetical protein